MQIQFDPKILLSQAVYEKADKNVNRKNPEELRKVCQEFEAIFIQTLFKNMRSTIPDGGLIEKNIDREIIEEMMDLEMAKQAAKKQDLGIAETLFRQLYNPDVDSD